MSVSNLQCLYSSLSVQSESSMLRWLHTHLRDASINHDAFVRYSDHLLRLLIEDAISTLEFQDKMVETPAGHDFAGLELAAPVVGVSLMPAGGSMESALRYVIRNAAIGKILIQHDPNLMEKTSKLIYSHLPRNIGRAQVLLLDPIIASGQSMLRAIQVLVDAGVSQSRITCVSLVSAIEGIHAVYASFPSINMMVSMIDELNDEKQVCPGLGNFGNRYYGI